MEDDNDDEDEEEEEEEDDESVTPESDTRRRIGPYNMHAYFLKGFT